MASLPRNGATSLGRATLAPRCGRFVLVAKANGFIVRRLPRVSDTELKELLERGEIIQLLISYEVIPLDRSP